MKKSYLCFFSSETVNFFLPLARRADTIRLPLADSIRSRNPCLLRRFLFDGWNVLFIIFLLFLFLEFSFGSAKVQNVFKLTKSLQKKTI